jgi:trehalose-phosphatase
MKLLNPDVDLERFLRDAAAADQTALLLDYDGTLAPFRANRDAAFPYSGVEELLNRCMGASHSRLIVVSGRPARDLTRLLQLSARPELWGCHGLERITPDGRYAAATPPSDLLRILEAEQEWLAAEGWGDWVELKPFGLALHTRERPPEIAEALVRVARLRWTSLPNRSLVIRDFDGGIELGLRDDGKDLAVRAILAELGPKGVAAYLGDDETDENAFRAIRGNGLGVLVRRRMRPTEADLWIRPPEELLEFLKRWIRAVEPGKGGHA